MSKAQKTVAGPRGGTAGREQNAIGHLGAIRPFTDCHPGHASWPGSPEATVYPAYVDPRVNDRQLEVLVWIDEGCLPGRWPQYDLSYKTSAAALANRDLVTLKGRGPRWAAATTDAGRYYLAHRKYPDGHRFSPKLSPPAPPGIFATEPARSSLPVGRRRRRRPDPQPSAIESPNQVHDSLGELADGERPSHPWDDKVLVSVKEAAWLLSLSEQMIRQAAVDGDVDRVFIGTGTTNYRIVHASLLAWVNSMPREPIRPRW